MTSSNFKIWNTVDPLSINASGLSVTSILFNLKSKPSDWIDNIFGHGANFIPSQTDVNSSDMYNSLNRFHDLEALPNSFELWPKCSFEVLGYARLDIEEPLMRYHKHQDPVIGCGHLIFGEADRFKWKCYYRAVFSFFEDPFYEGLGSNFWPILFYCPCPHTKISKLTCDDVLVNHAQHGIKSKMTILMKLNEVTWKNTFLARPREVSNAYNDIYSSGSVINAVCLVVPYKTSVADKFLANMALLSEFIRYYTQLGFQVFIYDKNGNSIVDLMNNKYARSRHIKLDFAYFNYTIRGLLDEKYNNLKYDNSEEQTRPIVRELQDLDKSMTLTHCRFELQAAYRIKNVLVADFDEFLFCPWAKPSFEAQKRFLDKFFKLQILRGVQQLIFSQRWVYPRNYPEQPRDCVSKKLKEGLSMFSCFSSYEFLAGGQNAKSVYFGHVCPSTDFHYSCTHGSYNYNCNCCSYFEHERCGMVHFGLSSKGYDPEVIRSYDPEKIRKALNSTNEIMLMTQIT
jgi:hypothetical protein